MTHRLIVFLVLALAVVAVASAPAAMNTQGVPAEGTGKLPVSSQPRALNQLSRPLRINPSHSAPAKAPVSGMSASPHASQMPQSPPDSRPETSAHPVPNAGKQTAVDTRHTGKAPVKKEGRRKTGKRPASSTPATRRSQTKPSPSGAAPSNRAHPTKTPPPTPSRPPSQTPVPFPVYRPPVVTE